MRRIAIVASHPIQYQAPWFRALAERIELTVFFCHRQDSDGQARAGFDVPFEWDVPVLGGYRHEWLKNVARNPGVDRFAGCDTPAIADRMRQGQFEACIVCGWYLKSYLQTVRAARRLGIPVLVRGDSQLNTTRRPITRMAKALPYRWALQRIDAHLFVGKRNKEYLQHYGVKPERLFFAPHFVDNDRFRAGAEVARTTGEAQQLRASWGATERTMVFLFAGKLLARKRPDDFVEGVLSLVADGHDVLGVIVGSGPEEARLRERSGRDGPIRFEGFQNQSQIPARYAAADCLVLPSDASETWGLVVNEAMATGMPAIATDAVGCGPDLINEGETGFVFPLGDVRALAHSMVRTIKLLETDRSAVRRALARTIDQFSCDAAVSGTMAALHAMTPGTAREHAAPRSSHA